LGRLGGSVGLNHQTRRGEVAEKRGREKEQKAAALPPHERSSKNLVEGGQAEIGIGSP